METLTRRSSELHSSIQQVISDDDLLTEILARLPIVSLFPFKIVSKRWLSLIKSPHFITLRRKQNPNIEPPCGLFLEIHKMSVRDGYDFVRFDKTNSFPSHTTFPFCSDADPTLHILHSCNGLLLGFTRPFKLFVFNPSTNQFKLLPEAHYSKLAQLKLVFDPIKSRHYKIVHVGILGDVNVHDCRSFQIQTYSSETCDWSVYPDNFSTISFAGFNDGIYWNGAIHWLDFEPLHYTLDVNHLVLTTIHNPPTVEGKMYFDHNLFESRGRLLHSCVVYTKSTRSRELNVYEMRNRFSEWSVKYIVDIDYVVTLIPKTPELHYDDDGGDVNDMLQRCLRCVVVGEREEDSFLVMELFEKVVKYNIESKTLSTIYEFTGFCVLRYFSFIPSLSGV